jgi:hypothetical protein
VQIQSNEQTLAVEEAAGHTDAAAALRVRIRGDLNAARAIPGCDVQDLALPDERVVRRPRRSAPGSTASNPHQPVLGSVRQG